jgi:hypothetical protein
MAGCVIFDYDDGHHAALGFIWNFIIDFSSVINRVVFLVV